MKKALAVFLSFAMLLTGCTPHDAEHSVSESSVIKTELTSESEIGTEMTDTTADIPTTTVSAAESEAHFSVDSTSAEYINALGFTSLNDPNLMRYVEDTVYSDLVQQLDSDQYFVENVDAVYISKEYLDELAYNSQENIYFGHKLSELDDAFQGEKYIFTLGENGQTNVIPFEEYDNTYDQVIRNVAVGTGVILLCVTVSFLTGGTADAVSMIFAASAKTASIFALSSGAISGVSAGIVAGFTTQDFEKPIKAAALAASEGFMWGAITGAITSGASEAMALHGATANGLTMNQVAKIQKESKYPLDVIKKFKNMEQYEIFKKAGLTPQMVNGKTALIRYIDPNYVDEATGLTNLERMKRGLAALDPTGKPYELHHIGQNADSPLAILTQEEHRLGENNKILHELIGESEIDRAAFDKIRKAFWKEIAKMLA